MWDRFEYDECRVAVGIGLGYPGRGLRPVVYRIYPILNCGGLFFLPRGDWERAAVYVVQECLPGNEGEQARQGTSRR